MIVVCPNCSKRYMLDDNLVPQEGRQVRCVTCHHVWRQISSNSSKISSLSIRDINAPFEARASSKRKSGWIGVVITLAMILSLLSAFAFGRDFVVKLWPRTDRFYDLIGLRMSPQGAGLMIANATSLTHPNDTQNMIQIAGNIINTSDRVRSIPPLKIKLIGQSSEILESWEHRLSERSLLPGEQIRFETDLHPKIDGTQQVSVEF